MAILREQYSDQHARAVWKSCIGSAFRTAFACILVGCVTLFGPAAFKNQITLPAFSYVTVILIVTDATLGDVLHGCWHAVHASLFGICPAILTLWLIGPAQLTASITAVAVAASAFVVVMQENSHLKAKRIALGQIVLVYVLAFINGSKTDPVMHPVHVLASTFVGVAACVLAMLLPYPSLATSEVKKNFKLFTNNASERLIVFIKAFTAEDKTSAFSLMLQAKSLANMGAKLLKAIKSKQETMARERLPINFFKPHCPNPAEKLQHLETPLRGMELALSFNDEQFPVGIVNSDQHLRDEITTESRIARQIKSMHLVSAITIPAENIVDDHPKHQLPSFPNETVPLDKKNLPSFFFLFCLKLLQKKSTAAAAASTPPLVSNPSKTASQKQEDESFFKRVWRNLAIYVTNKKFMPAFKSSLSLGLAVFLGAMYSKENAYWAGLPVAISLAASREPTFKVANVKAQGTVLGTVFGVFGWFMFQKYVLIRLLSLLPWFIFCSFLRRSRMYGQAGGISAVIGAILILGRKNFGPPSEFAIARITETFIGLSCSIAVEMILQPTRAASLARVELSKNLQVIQECVGGISFRAATKANLDESLKILKIQVNEFGKFIGEAEVEPNFWFLPFPSACYGKLLRSFSKMVELMEFTTSAIESLQQEEKGVKMDSNLRKEDVNRLNLDLNVFKNTISSSMKCCEEVSLVKSLKALDYEIERQKIPTDLEMGKPSTTFSVPKDHEKMEKNLASFLQHCQQLLDETTADEEAEIKGQILLSLSTLGFCMDGLIRETKEIEKGMAELLQWENPTSLVVLHEISSKISALQTSEL